MKVRLAAMFSAFSNPEKTLQKLQFLHFCNLLHLFAFFEVSLTNINTHLEVAPYKRQRGSIKQVNYMCPSNYRILQHSNKIIKSAVCIHRISISTLDINLDPVKVNTVTWLTLTLALSKYFLLHF